MYKQLDYIREGVTMTRGQTYRIDLPESGLLSALFLKLSAPCTNGATLADELWRLQDHLTTLEVIGNGATVIKSADWKNFAYLHFLRNKVTPLGAWRNYATNTQFEYLMVLFGRYLFDPDYGLDLSRWDSVEFKLTNTSSSTYHGSDITASIMAAYQRDHAGGFRGYLRTEKWREWTTVANETQYLVLPTEYPIAGIYLRALPDTTSGATDTSFENLMYDIDFSIEGGTKQVYKGGLDDLALIDYYMQGAQVLTGGHIDINADRAVDIGIGRVLGWAGTSGSKDGSGSSTVPTIEADSTSNTLKMETREADSPFHFLFQGYAFQNTVALWHSPMLDPAELLSPTKESEAKLNILTRNASSAADGTNQVILDRVVTR